MPPKSTRIRKPTNREPRSAIAAPTPIIPSSPDQLQVIDPQLLALNNATNSNSITVERGYSPFSDGYLDVDTISPSFPLTPSNNSQPVEDELDSRQSVQDKDKDKGKETVRPFAWTKEMEETMIQELVRQVVDNGKRADSGFKREAWTAVVDVVQACTGQEITVERCKNKMDVLKGLWRGFNFLLKHSGFGYDEATGMLKAPDDVWDELLKHHKLGWHRKHSLPYRNELDALYSVSSANGEFTKESVQSLEEGTLPDRIRNRKRGLLEVSLETNDTKKVRTRSQSRDQPDYTELITSIVKHQQSKLNPVQKAVRLLQTLYKKRLSSHGFLDAIDVLENKYKASAFIELEDASDRDNWLQRNANVEFEEELEEEEDI